MAKTDEEKKNEQIPAENITHAGALSENPALSPELAEAAARQSPEVQVPPPPPGDIPAENTAPLPPQVPGMNVPVGEPDPKASTSKDDAEAHLEEMRQILKSGYSVQHKNRVITREEDLPTAFELARGSLPSQKNLLTRLKAEQETRQREIESLESQIKEAEKAEKEKEKK